MTPGRGRWVARILGVWFVGGLFGIGLGLATGGAPAQAAAQGVALGGGIAAVYACMSIRVRRPTWDGPPRCAACGYDLAGLDEDAPCPECDARTRQYG